MFTLGIPDKQKRRTLGYLSNEYFPGGMKKLGAQIPYEIKSSEGGFFEISFPNMDEEEFRNITFQLKQQGVTVIGADSQLTERKMKLSDLLPLKEGMPTPIRDLIYFINANNIDPTEALESIGQEFGIDFEFGAGHGRMEESLNEPEVIRKKVREIIRMRESFNDDPNVQGTTGMEDAGGKVRDNILNAIPDGYPYKDLAQDIAYIISNEYGSHNVSPFLQSLTQQLQKPNY